MSDELKNYLGNINYEIVTSNIDLEKLDLGLDAKSWKELLEYLDTLEDREDYIGHLEELCNKYEEENKMYADLKDDYENRINDVIKYLASCDWNDNHYVEIYDLLMGDD